MASTPSPADRALVQVRIACVALMLGAATGTSLQIEATGIDAVDAADALAQLIENGFEEEDFPGA